MACSAARFLVMSAGLGFAGCFNPGAGEESSGAATTMEVPSTGAPTSGPGVTETGSTEAATSVPGPTEAETTMASTSTTSPTTSEACPGGCTTTGSESGTVTGESTSGETTTESTGTDGPLSFVSVEMGVSGAYAVAVADLDGADAYDDIVVTSDMLPAFTYYYGGDLLPDMQMAGPSLALAIADRAPPMDDGVVLGLKGSPAQVALYANAENWTKSLVSLPMICLEPTAVATGDIDGDLDIDVVVACAEYKDGAFVVRAAGGGFEQAVEVLDLQTQIAALALADVTDTNGLDLITTSTSEGLVNVYTNAGMGDYPTMWSFSFTVEEADRMAVGDHNDDDELDVVVTTLGGPGCAQLDGYESGIMAPMALACGASPIDVALGDVDGDLKPDIVTIHEGWVHVMLNMGGAFGVPIEFPGPVMPRRVAVGRFNGDAKLDVVVTSGSGAVTLLLQD